MLILAGSLEEFTMFIPE